MSKKIYWFSSLALLMGLLLSACGGGGDGAGTGEELFAQPIIGTQAGCSTCHSVQPDTIIVGPSLAGIGTTADTRVSGQSAEDYIRESIVDPEAYVVEGYQSGTMPQVWADELSDEQLDQLIAYLVGLK